MLTFFDSHFHIIDPRFPLVANQGFTPEIFTCDDYRKRTEPFHVIGGAIVSGSFHAFDQTYLLNALESPGPRYVGVTQLPSEVSDDELLRLAKQGIRAIRFNIRRGGSAHLSSLDYLARRVHDLVGWHTELYIDSKVLPQIFQVVASLPAVSIDHLGLSRDGFETVVSLAEKGVRVKATGFGRVDFDVSEAIRILSLANPSCLMFGTDLPSTRAERPFQDSDIAVVYDTLDGPLAERVLYSNALEWYRLPEIGLPGPPESL